MVAYMLNIPDGGLYIESTECLLFNNKHAYAGATDSYTHLRVLLVHTDRGMLAQSNQRR
jgi:hypothetical protein